MEEDNYFYYTNEIPDKDLSSNTVIPSDDNERIIDNTCQQR